MNTYTTRSEFRVSNLIFDRKFQITIFFRNFLPTQTFLVTLFEFIQPGKLQGHEYHLA